MFLLAYSRRPRADEVQEWSTLARELAGDADVLSNPKAWSGVAHTLLNTAEFLHYR
jgi:hypothetical protein